jgi:hypothetical protein
MIKIETDEAEVRVTIPNGDLPTASLQSILDWFRLENVAKNSSLTEEDADRLAEDIKSEWWAKNRTRFVSEDEGAQPG